MSAGSTAPDSLNMLRQMVLCRQFELLVEKLALAGAVRGMAHLGIGQEAVPAALAPLVTEHDWANGTYRNVTLGLCLGIPPALILGELLGKADGLCGGRGGHMHLFDLKRRFLGTDPVVGAAMGLGAGAAMSLKAVKKGVSIVFSGDGALGAGISHEVLNISKLWNLPALFVIENNGYAISTPLKETIVGSVLDRARAYQMPASSVDGNDARAVHRVAGELLKLVRNERGPALLECCTYRHRGHSKSDTRPYRTRSEEQQWLQRDPIQRLAAELEAEGVLKAGGLQTFLSEADAQLDEALREAQAMTKAVIVGASRPHSRLGISVAEQRNEPEAGPRRENGGEKPPRQESYRQAINEALHEALASDPRVIFCGQDIGVFGGAYKASVGLQEKFGRERVIDTPIAELGVCQMLAGAAATGLRPIFEVMFGDFLALCSDAIINHAAKFRFCSNGSVSVPLVIRAPFGPGNGFGATHSQSVERWFAHVPGLKVYVPSTPHDVRAAILTGVRGEDPVLILEPITLYANEGLVSEDAHFDERARLAAEGSRVTVVSYGRALYAALAARAELPDPSAVEVIDLRSITPLDRETILASAAKTGALLVVEDGHRTFGLGGEIIASVIEAGMPLRHGLRVSGADVPTPYAAELEASAFPSPQQVADVLQRVLQS
ncbi:MAG TPA: thiamine pyrophosphate-dependent enzyme [Planctomycetota bacterium]|nr:thiamine pyrophosphate-dependent enzyme [Planctomycetota bacterium]